MPCFVERTGFTGGRPTPGASDAGTLFSRGRGPTSNPSVSGRRQDEQGRIEIPLNGSTNHITQYDPNSPYRVSWDVSADGDTNVRDTVHPTNQHRPPPQKAIAAETLEPDDLIRGADLWMTHGAGDRVDIYSSNHGVFDPQAEDPSRFDFREGGWEALAREIADDPREAGGKMYVHGVGHLEGEGDQREIVYDDVVRGSGVAGAAQPPDGWGL